MDNSTYKVKVATFNYYRKHENAETQTTHRERKKNRIIWIQQLRVYARTFCRKEKKRKIEHNTLDPQMDEWACDWVDRSRARDSRIRPTGSAKWALARAVNKKKKRESLFYMEGRANRKHENKHTPKKKEEERNTRSLHKAVGTH